MSAESGSHKSRGRLTQNDFAMLADVVAVRVADENAVGPRLRLVRVEPQLQPWQIDAAAVILKRKYGHRDNLAARGWEVQGRRRVERVAKFRGARHTPHEEGPMSYAFFDTATNQCSAILWRCRAGDFHC